MTHTKQVPTFFIPHGGGPCFFMEWPGNAHMWDRMADFLKDMHNIVGEQPKAIVIISGHWIEKQFTVTAGLNPSLIYDYHGFPPHTYELTYPAPGAPALAQRIVELLAAADIPGGEDRQRGFDHGVFIPLKLVYPDANIPVVQLSMKKGLDPEDHLNAGRALQVLREEGVLIIGSGMSFHNMRGYNAAFTDASRRFDDWLTDTLVSPTANRRDTLLIDWENAPDARQTQPHPDHLLPLMVAAGAAGDSLGRKIFEDKVMEVIVSGYVFGEATTG